ncbi:nucleoredoxin-like protein 2 [Limulus polyphemus]|uniref:Nucleoredoxin-like protein 2 n=1 Tax=Limulus polyphemus TaxID=6850 RepID=A0ABM1C4Z2_LIMPO|nr:nucleoredoxin-like protein 2 [Limulus polyphemus]
MDIIQGQKLFKKDKSEVDADEILQDKEIIGFYFSAHWCPPCRAFTPILTELYGELRNENAPFEVVFVSSDQSEDDMFSYMEESHGDWLAVQFDGDVSTKLSEKFAVDGIPTFIILKKDGTVITESGVEEVTEKGAEAFKEWLG